MTTLNSILKNKIVAIIRGAKPDRCSKNSRGIVCRWNQVIGNHTQFTEIIICDRSSFGTDARPDADRRGNCIECRHGTRCRCSWSKIHYFAVDGS